MDILDRMRKLAGIEEPEPPAPAPVVVPEEPAPPANPLGDIDAKFTEKRPEREYTGFDSMDDAVAVMNKRAAEGWR